MQHNTRNRPALRRTPRAGFTLVELMVSMAVTAIMAVGAFQMALFLSKSTTQTANRANAVSKAFVMSGQIQMRATDANLYVLYSDYGPDANLGGYEDVEGNLNISAKNSFYQSNIHVNKDKNPITGGDPEGNYLVFVELYDDSNVSDEYPGDLKRLTGYYLGPRTWLVGGSSSSAPNYIPVRRYTLDFEAGVAPFNGEKVLEHYLPAMEITVYKDHEIIGYVDQRRVANGEALFRVVDEQAVSISMPIQFRPEADSASFLLQTTLLMVGI